MLAAATDRAAIAASVADPARRLAALVAHHLPGRGTGLHRALAEIPAHAADHPELAAVAMVAIEDRVDAFVAALDDGVRSGAFRPVAPVEVLARGLVAQLDAAAAYQAAGIETPAATTDSILGHLAAVLACPAVLDGAARRPVPAGLRGAEVPASGAPEAHDVGVALRS